MVIIALMFFGLSKVYDKTIRYVAYGEITAKTIRVAAPWPGVVSAVYKRDGDEVAPGDLIARIESVELQQKIDSIDDSLRVQRAQLSAEFATIRWEAEKIKDSRRLSQSDFYDKYSELLWQQSRLSDLRNQEKRLRPLVREGAAAKERIQTIAYQLAGQEKRVEQLKQAVAALRSRGDHDVELSLEERVRPTLVRIENLQSELDRTRTLRSQGEVRCQSRGRISTMTRFAGEYADQTQPIAELILDGSQEFVIYLPQDLAGQYGIGKFVSTYVPSIDRSVRCQVKRYAARMQRAPDSLVRFYSKGESLLPVYMTIVDQDFEASRLPIGSEIRIARKESGDVVDRAIASIVKWWDGDARPDRKPHATELNLDTDIVGRAIQPENHI